MVSHGNLRAFQRGRSFPKSQASSIIYTASNKNLFMASARVSCERKQLQGFTALTTLGQNKRSEQPV